LAESIDAGVQFAKILTHFNSLCTTSLARFGESACTFSSSELTFEIRERELEDFRVNLDNDLEIDLLLWEKDDPDSVDTMGLGERGALRWL